MIRQAINNDYTILSTFYREFDSNGVDMFSHDPFARIFVYEKDGSIIGFISYSIAYERAELNYIYVYLFFSIKYLFNMVVQTLH